MGPLEFFRSRGNFASLLTGLRFQFRLEIPDQGFVNSNYLLEKFIPSSRNLCNNFCAIAKVDTFVPHWGHAEPTGWQFDVCVSVQSKCGRQMPRNSSRMCIFFTSLCGLPPGYGAHVPHFGHQSTFGVVLTSGRSLCPIYPHESAELSVKLCFGQQFPHHTLPPANCGSPLEFSRVIFQF